MHDTIDPIEEFAAEYLLVHQAGTPQSLIAQTVARFPTTPALHAAFALVSLAANLEEPIADLDLDGKMTARALYRCISAFTADICAVSHLHQGLATCIDVENFWALSHDTFFHVANV